MTAVGPATTTTARSKSKHCNNFNQQKQQNDVNVQQHTAATQGENDTLVKYEQPFMLLTKPTSENDNYQSGKVANYKKWRQGLTEDDKTKNNDEAFPDDATFLQQQNKSKTGSDGSGFKAPHEILDALLPPREWLEGGQRWMQRVSRMPPSRLDIMNLHEQLDIRLEQLRARESGIDPVRRELYSQCFDELIRQITLTSPERGLLLLRIRDEARMTLVAFQGLFESSIAYGTRKSILTEQTGNTQQLELIELKQQRADTHKQLNEWKVMSELIEKKFTELRQLDEKRHQEEIHNLKRTNQQLKNQLEGIINPKAMLETPNITNNPSTNAAKPTAVAPAVSTQNPPVL